MEWAIAVSIPLIGSNLFKCKEVRVKEAAIAVSIPLIGSNLFKYTCEEGSS